MRLVLLGPPGAGKGTQAARLAAHLRVPHVSTGDIFRRSIAEDTELGRLARVYIDRGDLVPDGVVIRMVMERLAEPDCREGFVLDGYPRTVAQAEALDKELETRGTPLDAALVFEISEEELFRRLANRATQLHRSDDAGRTIRRRLEVFTTKTQPIADYYKERGVLVAVDAVGPVEEITQRILADLYDLTGKQL